MSAKAIIASLLPVFEHSNRGVRAQCMNLAASIHQWNGAGVERCFEKLRPAQMKELSERWSAEEAKPEPSRHLRGAALPGAVAAGGGDATPDIVAPEPEQFQAEAVEVLSGVPGNLAEQAVGKRSGTIYSPHVVHRLPRNGRIARK